MYPILLQYLFVNVGFAWGVRVSAIICFVFCTTATLTVTSGVAPAQAPAKGSSLSWLDLRALKDPKFALLVAGSCFMALGTYIAPSPIDNLPISLHASEPYPPPI